MSKTRSGNEKLAWGDQVATREFKSDEEFHTPIRSRMKEGATTSPQPRPKVHLEVDSHVHSTIVKQLIKHIAISSSQESTSTKNTTKEKVRGSKRSTLTHKSLKL